jgi:hypothetical protein
MDKEQYTLITGGSQGIGKGFAFECARRRMNILLVALPGKELENTVSELKEKYPVKVDNLAVDLIEKDAPQNVYNWCKKNNFTVNILINNAGIGGTTVFDKSTPEYCDMRIQLNIRALVLLCRYFIPEMKKLSKAYILNISSLSAFFAIPYKSVYASTKAFIFHFSKAIRDELYDTSISVSVVCPNGVYSNKGTYSRIAAHGNKGRATAISVEELAEITITKMLKGKVVIIPKFINKTIIVLMKMLPANLVQRLLRKEFKKEIEIGN